MAKKKKLEAPAVGSYWNYKGEVYKVVGVDGDGDIQFEGGAFCYNDAFHNGEYTPAEAPKDVEEPVRPPQPLVKRIVSYSQRLTLEELAELGKRQSDKLEEIERQEEALSAVKAEYKGTITRLEAEVSEIAPKLRTQQETRQATAIVEFDVPNKVAHFYECLQGEVKGPLLKSGPMTHGDHEQVLAFEQEWRNAEAERKLTQESMQADEEQDEDDLAE